MIPKRELSTLNAIWASMGDTMNKHTKGIERALQMKQWSDKKGGLPARKDPFEGGEAGVFDRRVRQWIAELRQRELSPATIETYRWPLLRFRTWLLKHHRGEFTRVGTLFTLRRVESFLADPSTADTQSRAAAVGTLCRFSAWLAARDHVGSDPLRKIVRSKRKSRRLPRFLNPEQITRLLEIPDTTDPLGIRDRSMMETFYASGVRRSELCSICLSDLDFHSRQILIRHGKGDRQRLVPAGVRAFAWINRYLAEVRPQLASSDDPTAPLYVTGYGGAFAPGSLGNLFRRYLNRAGITMRGATHLMRHSCATHLHDRGAPLLGIQRILGHSRLDTTAIYTHVSTAKLVELHARYHPHGDLASTNDREDTP